MLQGAVRDVLRQCAVDWQLRTIAQLEAMLAQAAARRLTYLLQAAEQALAAAKQVWCLWAVACMCNDSAAIYSTPLIESS